MRKIEKIVVHVTDTCDSLDVGAKEIDAWHREQGWSKIGYHFVVRRNGRVEIGRKLDEIGAHVKGHNSRSVGVVWVGRKTPTAKQYKVLTELVTRLMKEYKLPFDEIYGHTELDSRKTCPNMDMDRLRAEVLFCDDIRDEVEEAVRVGKGP